MRARILALTVLLLLPGLGLSAKLILYSYRTERSHAEEALQDHAQLISLGIDRQFLQAEVLLRTLSATGDLARGDIAAFAKLARSTAVLNGHLILLRRDGHELMNTSRPENAGNCDEPPPENWDREVPGRVFISNLVQRPDSGELAVTVVLPLTAHDAHELDLVFVIPVASLRKLLEHESLAAGWSTAILDRNATIAASFGAADGSAELIVGRPLTDPATRATLLSSSNGLSEHQTDDGGEVIAFHHSSSNGWIAATLAPSLLITANAARNLQDVLLNGVVMLLLGIGVAFMAAGSITRPIEALANAARHLGDTDQLPDVPRGLSEAELVASIMQSAASSLRERREALQELNATLTQRVDDRTAALNLANNSLTEQRERLGLILDNMPFAVMVINLDETIGYANPEARRLLGADAGPMTARHLPKTVQLGTDPAFPLLPSALTRAGGKVERRVLRATMQDGRALDIEVTAGPVYGRDGKLALSVVAFQDITERVAAEEARRRAQRLEAIGQLTGGVAHEFNNLLMAITGSLDLLAPLVPAGRGIVLLEGAQRAADRGGRLTRQLLAFSRRQHLQTQNVDLNALITSMTELLASTLGRLVQVRTDLAADASPAIADPAQLELVLLNLSINARDAMRQGGTLTIGTENVTRGEPLRAEEPPAGEYVRLYVADTGTGMAPDILARVFEPFFTTKEIGHGTGLGLPQVLGVAQQLGGGVHIDSAPGKGSVVNIYLKRAGSAATIVAPVRSPAIAPRALEHRHILLVDDDEDVRNVTRDILLALGGAVLDAESGDAALALLENSKVDIILADLTMPGMNGIELATLIGTKKPGLPVVLMTGYSAASLDNLPGPVIATLLKPFRAAQLVDTLTRALDHKPPFSS